MADGNIMVEVSTKAAQAELERLRAENLLPALCALKPVGNVVICADNDHATQMRRGVNPGREKATIAADHVGCGVAWPSGIEGSDWADAMKEIGVGAARKIERQILSASKYVATG